MYVLKSDIKTPELMVISAIWAGRRVGRLSWDWVPDWPRSYLWEYDVGRIEVVSRDRTEDALGKKISKHKRFTRHLEQGDNGKPKACHWQNESTVMRQESSYRWSRGGPQSHLWMRGLTLRGMGTHRGVEPNAGYQMWPWTKLEAQRWVLLLQECSFYKLDILMPILQAYVDNLIPSVQCL